MNDICIFGCGPAGLLSAYAAEMLGGNVTIVSHKQRSKIPGAVFLHERIPGISPSLPDATITFVKRGTKRGYAKKVYGNEDADCSWDLFPEGRRPAWSMFALYDKLWRRFERRIRHETISHEVIESVLMTRFDRVISTIPAPFLCYNDSHKFPSQKIHILNKSVDDSINNGMVYNGDPRYPWYRTSRLFGSEATEATKPFPPGFLAELGVTSKTGYKPLKTDCDCYMGEVVRVGRFGRWEKGVLVHHAYKQTVELMDEFA